MKEVLSEIGRLKLVPVVAIEEVDRAPALGDALVGGGLPLVEVTFRTGAAEASIRVLAGRGDLMVGAGTVLTVDQARRAVDAGARFIVSPGLSTPVVEYCMNAGVAAVPGVCTPTEIMTAMDMGLSVLKFFPAEASGGLDMLRAVSAPLDAVWFIPTGGVVMDNLAEYLSFPRTFACGGTWLAPAHLISERRFDEITGLCREALAIAARAGRQGR